MVFFAQQMPNFTTNSAAVLRQQTDESNHEIVHILAQKIGIIFNPLIQNTTQRNQQMAAQMTRIVDLFGVPQAPRQLRREWVVENQGAILEEDPAINQIC